jgi:NSS family neurotransmitter:Na+ symporter
MEVISSYFIDEKGWGRKKAALIMGFVVILVGIPSALATKTGFLNPDKVGFDVSALIGHIAADYMLPIGAFFMSIFVGFVWKKSQAVKEAAEGSSGFALAPIWIFIIRWIAPFIIGQIILLGFLKEFESLNKLIEKLSRILSIADAVIVGLLVVGSIVYLVLQNKKKTGEA